MRLVLQAIVIPAALLVAMVASAPMAAWAHGRPPSVRSVLFDPDDPSHIVATATWGLLVSRDAGGSFRWGCAAAMGVDPVIEDPRLVFTPEGLVGATFDGLIRGGEDACVFEPVSELGEEFFTDIAVDPGNPSSVYVVRSVSGEDDALFHSSDGGQSFEQIARIPDVLVERIALAPSDPDRIYLSGAIPRRPMSEPRGFVLVSSDAGRTFERREVALEMGEWNVLLGAVHPSRPDWLLARVVHFNGPLEPERLLVSEDAGQTFRVLISVPQIGGTLVTLDGTILVGSAAGGLQASRDDGQSFSMERELSVHCLESRGDEIWLCADQTRDGVAILRSMDDAATFSPVLSLPEVGSLIDCPTCSDTGIVCPAWSVDVAIDLQLDGGVSPELVDAMTGAPRDAGVPPECLEGGAPSDDAAVDGSTDPGDIGGGGCACATHPGPTSNGLSFVAFMWLVLRRRARRTGKTRPITGAEERCV